MGLQGYYWINSVGPPYFLQLSPDSVQVLMAYAFVQVVLDYIILDVALFYWGVGTGKKNLPINLYVF